MIEKITAYIQPIISTYGAWGVFWATLMEEIIAPIPSPLVPLTGGFFLLPGSGSLPDLVLKALLIIALPVALGITVGSLAVYGLGYRGGKPVIEKSKKWLGLSWEDVANAERKISRGKGDEITLFVLRVLPVIPGVAVSVFCGIVRYPLKKFVTVTFSGAFVRAAILGVTGWYAGSLYTAYADAVSRIENYIFVVLIFPVLFFLGRFTLKKFKAKKK